MNKEKGKIMSVIPNIKRKNYKNNEAPIEVKYGDLYLKQLKNFTTGRGIYLGKQIEVAKCVKLLADIAENYQWNIDNIMNEREVMERKRELIKTVTQDKKLALIKLIVEL